MKTFNLVTSLNSVVYHATIKSTCLEKASKKFKKMIKGNKVIPSISSNLGIHTL